MGLARTTWAILALGALAACGVPGRPTPGPEALPAPSAPRLQHRPDGLWLQATLAPAATAWLAWADDPACTGAPLARAPAGAPLHLPFADSATRTLYLAAAAPGRLGPPSAAFAVRWQAPPAAPEAPIAFVAQGAVQLSWLPPAAPVQAVRIVRDGRPVHDVDAALGGHADSPPPGPHRYALVGLGADFETAPSPTIEVLVPPP